MLQKKTEVNAVRCLFVVLIYGGYKETWQDDDDDSAPPFGIKKAIIKRLKKPFFCYKQYHIILPQFLIIIYPSITPATLLTALHHGPKS